MSFVDEEHTPEQLELLLKNYKRHESQYLSNLHFSAKNAKLDDDESREQNIYRVCTMPNQVYIVACTLKHPFISSLLELAPANDSTEQTPFAFDEHFTVDLASKQVGNVLHEGYTLAKISKKNSGPSGPRDASSSDFFKLQVPFRGKLLELLNIGNYVRSIQESLKKYPLDRASEKIEEIYFAVLELKDVKRKADANINPQ